jgi:hypothetical protein
MVNQASLPSPRTWSANDLVTVPRLRADAVDAIAFLLQRPTFVGQVTTGKSYASGSDLPMFLDTEVIDTWAGHQQGTAVSGSVNPSRYYCQVPGWYLCRSAPAFSYTSATQAAFAGSLEGLANGAGFGPQRGQLTLDGSTNPPVPQCVDLVQLVVTGPPGGGGDYVQFDAIQTSGGSVSLVSAATQLPTASARWVCATSGTQPLPVPPRTACPSPITHAWLNADVRDTINYLIYPPILRVFYTSTGATLASQAFPAGSTAPLNTVTVDNYGGFNTGTFTYTVPVAGRYLIAGQMNLAAAASSTGYGCGIQVNGATIAWGDVVLKVSDSTGGGAGVVRRVRLSAGDTVKLAANQGSGGAIAWNGSGSNPTRLVMVWEGI